MGKSFIPIWAFQLYGDLNLMVTVTGLQVVVATHISPLRRYT